MPKTLHEQLKKSTLLVSVRFGVFERRAARTPAQLSLQSALATPSQRIHSDLRALSQRPQSAVNTAACTNVRNPDARADPWIASTRLIAVNKMGRRGQERSCDN